MATVHMSTNGIDLSVVQETVKAMQQDPDFARCQFRVHNQWIDGDHSRTTIESFYAGKQENSHQTPFQLDADEPPMLAGRDEAPNPVEHLLNSLATCVTTSMVAHAAVRGIEIEELECDIEGDIDLRGFFGLENDVPKGFQNIRVTFQAKSDADSETLKSLAEFSPTYNTLLSGVDIDLRVQGPAQAGAGEQRPEA